MMFTLHIFLTGERYPCGCHIEVVEGYLAPPKYQPTSDYCFTARTFDQCWEHFTSYVWEEYVYDKNEIAAYDARYSDFCSDLIAGNYPIYD
jgi:hypothetical protein